MKGDLPNLLLNLPSFAPSLVAPWIDGLFAADGAESLDALARKLAEQRAEGLVEAGIDEKALEAVQIAAPQPPPAAPGGDKPGVTVQPAGGHEGHGMSADPKAPPAGGK